LSGLPLVIGVWLAELLTDSGCRPELKWPNDLLSSKVEKIEGEIAGREKAAGKKIGGVLVEVKPEYGRLFVYVGIGLNLESSPEGLSGSSSVRQAFGIRLGVEELARQILIRIREEFPKLWREGFLAFRARWLKFGPRVGTLLSIKTADSNSAEAKTQVGYFQGLREDGALRLLVNGIEISVCSGQVLLRAS
jgi:BirA family biotin operon repressor/biotin-[acetyl-CoA-carboxylase] ligase